MAPNLTAIAEGTQHAQPACQHVPLHAQLTHSYYMSPIARGAHPLSLPPPADFGFDEQQRDRMLGGAIAAAFYMVGAPAALLFGW